MKQFLLTPLLIFFFIGNACAENIPVETGKAENPADFEYISVKIDGRVTVYGDAAMYYLTGENAKAVYYHMQAKEEKDVVCRAGVTKKIPGLLCTKLFLQEEKENFECYIGINLKKGQIESYYDEETCPEGDDEESYKYWDARGNKMPRKKK